MKDKKLLALVASVSPALMAASLIPSRYMLIYVKETSGVSATGTKQFPL